MVDILPVDPAKQVPLLSAVSDGPEPVTPTAPVVPEPEPSAPEPVVEPVEEKPREPSPRETRFAEYAKRTREAEARADRLARIAEEAVAAVQRMTEAQKPPPAEPVTPQLPTPPRREAYDSPEAYDAAWGTYTAQTVEAATKRMAEELDRRQAKAAEDQRAQAAQTEAETRQRTVMDSWAAKRAEAAKKYDDYAEVAEADIPITDPIRDGILTADNGPDIAYHLGKNPEEIERIARLPPIQQLVEIGKISATLNQPAPRPRVSQVPPPLAPVGNNAAGGEADISTMTTDEYAARRMPQLRAERRAGMLGIPRN